MKRSSVRGLISILLVLVVFGGIFGFFYWFTYGFTSCSRIKSSVKKVGDQIDSSLSDDVIQVKAAANSGLTFDSDYAEVSFSLEKLAPPSIELGSDGRSINVIADIVSLDYSELVIQISYDHKTVYARTVEEYSRDLFTIVSGKTVAFKIDTADFLPAIYSGWYGIRAQYYCNPYKGYTDYASSDFTVFNFYVPYSAPEPPELKAFMTLDSFKSGSLMYGGSFGYKAVCYDAATLDDASNVVTFDPDKGRTNGFTYFQRLGRLGALNIDLLKLPFFLDLPEICTLEISPFFKVETNLSVGSGPKVNYIDSLDPEFLSAENCSNNILIPRMRYVFSVSKLDCPENLKVSNLVLSWDPVANADKYFVFCDAASVSEEVDGTTLNLARFGLTGGDYLFRVRALGNIGQELVDSDASERTVTPFNASVNVKQLAVVNYSISGDIVSKFIPLGDTLSDHLYDVEVKGKTFGGWFYDDGFSRPVSKTDKLTGDVTVYARLMDKQVKKDNRSWWSKYKWAVLGPILSVVGIVVIGLAVEFIRRRRAKNA